MNLQQLKKELEKVKKKSQKLADARSALPVGSSRSRVTTANARWARAAEYRELLRRKIAELEGEEKRT